MVLLNTDPDSATLYLKVVRLQMGNDYNIYMDVCCLNRPFDDQSQDRIYFESEAVLTILSHCRSGKWTLTASDVIDSELSRLSNEERAEKVRELYSIAKTKIALTPQAVKLAKSFQQQGLHSFDSLHLAIAELSGQSVLLTTDDKFVRKASTLELNITVANPATWLMEVLE